MTRQEFLLAQIKKYRHDGHYMSLPRKRETVRNHGDMEVVISYGRHGQTLIRVSIAGMKIFEASIAEIERAIEKGFTITE